MVAPKLTVTVPNEDLHARLEIANRELWGGQVRLVPWTMQDPPPPAALAAEMAVVGHYWSGGYDLAHLSRLPGLRLVQLPSAGFEHALAHLPAGVALANGKGVHSAETAELAMGLILAAQRGIDVARDMQHAHNWLPTAQTHRFRSLADRRVLVVGAGSVAMALVRRLAPFEVDITVVGRTARPDAELAQLASAPNPADFADPAAGARLPANRIDPRVHAVSELPNLLPDAEIVVLTVPADASTRHLLDAASLALLPDGALVVNVARGSVVDTDALVAELRSGRLRAALDVTDPEPLPAGHPLWDAPNTLITPHVGGNTTAADVRFAVLVERQISRLLAGEPPLNVVETGSPSPAGPQG